MPQRFNIHDFLDIAFNDDACVSGTRMSDYLDAARMGGDFIWSNNVLTVQEDDGTRRHFKITAEEIEL